MQEGFQLFTPTFKGLNAKLDLTEIEICDSTGTVLADMSNELTIQKMNDEGTYLTMYGYSPEDGGWNIDYEPIEFGDVDFEVGESICVYNDWGSTVYFRVSGEVDLVNMCTVGTGFVLWGNATPVSIDLTDVSICDSEGNILNEMSNEVTVQKMNEEGTYLTMYGYSPEDGGWNIDYEPIEKDDFTLAPGESCCVYNDWGESVYFKLPRPVK